MPTPPEVTGMCLRPTVLPVMRRLQGLYILAPESFELIYGPQERRDIAQDVEIIAPPFTATEALAHSELLARADVIFSGWGGPVLDQEFLTAAARLKAFFYGGGGMGVVLTPAVWERGIRVSSAISANSIPVAEYTLATILFSLKHGWRLSRQMRQERRILARDGVPGCYGSTVGLISLGSVARILLQLLEPFALNVLAHDPFLTEAQAKELRVQKVSLEDLFTRSDVVSLHAPLLPETVGMITGRHLDSMKNGATFINTARGAVVREREMIAVLARRPDLQAVLDVTTQEPPEFDSPLYTLENVVLTPHIAGSAGPECMRMGRYMVEELRRYLAGAPLKLEVTPDATMHSSHRPVARSEAAQG
jgi:phosphoglycerate dehydrogenase-like enzyme